MGHQNCKHPEKHGKATTPAPALPVEPKAPIPAKKSVGKRIVDLVTGK